MKYKFQIIFIVYFLLSNNLLVAQSDVSMITHSFNRASYNPAAIARPNFLYLYSNARSQWNGVEGAPTVMTVQASQFFQSMNSAFGISLVSEKIGISRVLNPMLTYAFRMENDKDWSVSMGISAGVFSRNYDGTQFEPVNYNDPALRYDIEQIVRPDVNVGFEFQSSHYIIGLSSTHLFDLVRSESLFLASNHRYLYAMFKQNDIELFNYNVGLQLINRNNLTVLEGSANIRFKHATGLWGGPREIFDLGAVYRSSKQLSFLVGVNIFKSIRVGYAYNQSFNVGYNLNTTHEIMLECRIATQASSTRSRGQKDEFWYH